MGASAGSGTGDHVIDAIAINIAGRHIDTTSKQRVVGKEAANLLAALSAEHLDMGASAGSGTGDHVKDSISINMPLSDAHTSCKIRVIGIELIKQITIKCGNNAHMRASACSCAGNEIEVIVDNCTINSTPGVDFILCRFHIILGSSHAGRKSEPAEAQGISLQCHTHNR